MKGSGTREERVCSWGFADLISWAHAIKAMHAIPGYGGGRKAWKGCELMGTERRPPKHRARTKLAHPTKGRTVKVTTLSDSQLRRMTRATKRIGKDGQKVRVWK